MSLAEQWLVWTCEDAKKGMQCCGVLSRSFSHALLGHGCWN